MAQESKYSYDEESVKAIVHWAQTAQLPKEVTLSESEHIIDTSMYVHANICDINQHYPDPFYNPAIDRLYRLKEVIENRRLCQCSGTPLSVIKFPVFEHIAIRDFLHPLTVAYP